MAVQDILGMAMITESQVTYNQPVIVVPSKTDNRIYLININHNNSLDKQKEKQAQFATKQLFHLTEVLKKNY